MLVLEGIIKEQAEEALRVMERDYRVRRVDFIADRFADIRRGLEAGPAVHVTYKDLARIQHAMLRIGYIDEVTELARRAARGLAHEAE